MIKKLKLERTIFLICLIICLLTLIISGLQAKAMQAEIDELQYQNSRQAAQLLDRQAEIEMLEAVIKNREQDASEPMATEPEYIGEFEITYYTAGPESTGKTPDHPAYGITRSGTVVEEGRTIATDWDVLPPGTKVYIDGIGERIVEDTGGAIVDKCIDVYVEDLEVALQGGRHKADVWIVKEKKQ
jgi:3D (Asp-Asp-Asp) domain-containing protein